MNKEFYEVNRNDYKEFISTIKSDCRDIRIENISDVRQAANVYSKKTNKLLCGREYNIQDVERMPEKYYIYSTPDAEESVPARGKIQITLETKEEVQKFFDYLSKQEKTKK